jgi:hypothetical protein
MPGVADWTGDGIVDFVFARELPWATTYDPYGASRSRRLESVLVSGADGDIFGPAVVATGDGLEPLITTIGDLDGDGIADLVSVDAYAGPSSLAATVTARDGLGGPLWSRYITAPHGFDYGCACFSGTIATAVYPAAIRGDAAGGDLVVGLLSDVNEDWWSQRWGSHRPVAPANLIGLRGDTGQTVFQADPTLPTDFAVGGDIDGDGLADLQTGTIYAPGTCTGAIVDAAWTAGVNEVAWGAQENVECYGNYGGYRLITSTVTYAPGDLDADGVPDHLSMASPSVGTGTWRARSGVDGSLLWEHFYVWSSSGIDSGRLLPLGIDIGGGPGADLLEHDGRPVVLRLRDGALKDELWTATLPELTYVDSAMPDPGFVVADIDRDGTDDLIVAITWGQSPHRNKLYALDGRDGSILWTR